MKKTPFFTAPSAFTQKYGERDSDAKYPSICGELWFPLVRGKNLLPNARAFSHHSSDPNYYEIIWALQVAILGIEDGMEGSFFINIDKEAKPQKYRRVLQAIARRQLGSSKSSDAALLQSTVVPSRRFSPMQIKDVAEVYAQMDAIQKEKEASKNANADVDVDADIDIVAAPRNPDCGRVDMLNDIRYEHQYMSRIITPHWNTVNLSIGDSRVPQVFTDNADEMEVEIEIEDEVEPAVEMEMEEGNEDERDENLESMSVIDEMLAYLRNSNGGTIPKVNFVVMPIENNIGYVVRVLIHDPKWSMGATMDRLMKNQEFRKKARTRRNYVDPHADYLSLFGKKDSLFPLCNVSKDKWLNVCNKIMKQDPNMEVLEDQYGQSWDNYSHDIHPRKIFSMDRMLQYIIDSGGSADIWKRENFISEDGKQVMWPEASKHYYYMPEQVFWYRQDRLGLAEMTFPDTNVANEAFLLLNTLQLINEEGTMIDTEESDKMVDKLYVLSSQSPVISRVDMQRLLPNTSDIPTSNIILLTYMDFIETYSKLLKNRPKNYNDIMHRHFLMNEQVSNADLQRCKKFTKCVDKLREHYLREFSNIFQLHNSVEHVTIPDTLKVIIQHVQRNYKTTPINREMRLYDPLMSCFANMQSRHLLYLDKTFMIKQPIISIKVEGVFCVFANRKFLRIPFQFIVTGAAQKGKSFTVIEGGKKQMIEGTYYCYNASSDAAMLTDQDHEHEIVLMDEIEEFWVNPAKANGKDAKKANAVKSAVTEGVQHYMVYQNITVWTSEGEETIRGSRLVSSRQNITRIGTTNYHIPKVKEGGALISRMHIETMKACSSPLAKYDYAVDPLEKKIAREFMCISQAMIAIVEQAITMGAIVGPTMAMSKRLDGNFIDHLIEAGVVDKKEGVRYLGKMESFERTLIIKSAVAYCYDYPGGPFYNRCYDPSHMPTIQRYLYSQEDIYIYTRTLLHDEFVDEDCGNVLKAACKWVSMRQEDYESDDVNLYNVFVNKLPGCDHIAKKFNKKWNKDTKETEPKEHILLDYMEIPGDIDSVCRSLAELTDPRMEPSLVKNTLEFMATRQFKPKRVFQLMDPMQLNNHRVIQHRKAELNCLNCKSTVQCQMNNLDREEIMDLAREYDGKSIAECIIDGDVDRIVKSISITSADAQQFNTGIELLEHLNLTPIDCHCIIKLMDAEIVWEYGTDKVREFVQPNPTTNRVPKMSDICDSTSARPSISICVFDTAIKTRKKVYFAPAAIKLFDKEIVLRALENSIICGTTRPGKRLLGWPDNRDHTKFATVNWSKEFIDQHIKYYDASRPSKTINGTVVYKGTSRTEGIVFDRRGYKTKAVTSMLIPTLKQQQMSARSDDTNSVQLIENLDEYSAREHHIVCPDPFNEPVRDYKYIMRAYKSAMESGTVSALGHGEQNYPDTFIEEDMRIAIPQWDNNKARMLTPAQRKELEEIKRRK